MFFFLPNGYDKQDVIEFFNNMPTPHGVTFDNGKRWCGNCNHLQSFDKLACDDGWLNKACGFCHAIWPEFVEDYLDMDEQEAESFVEIYQSETRN